MASNALLEIMRRRIQAGKCSDIKGCVGLVEDLIRAQVIASCDCAYKTRIHACHIAGVPSLRFEGVRALKVGGLLRGSADTVCYAG